MVLNPAPRRRARSQHPYKIYVCGVYAPLDAVQRRALTRAKETGRSIPNSFMSMQHGNIFPEGEGGTNVCYAGVEPVTC